MKRKQFWKKITAILTAAALGMSLGACGGREEAPAGGTGASEATEGSEAAGEDTG